jgi:chromatin modification-related protein EAF6
MSQSGPPADAKQAQAAALAELENAQRRKRAIDTSLVRAAWLHCRTKGTDTRAGEPRGVDLGV